MTIFNGALLYTKEHREFDNNLFRRRSSTLTGLSVTIRESEPAVPPARRQRRARDGQRLEQRPYSRETSEILLRALAELLAREIRTTHSERFQDNKEPFRDERCDEEEQQHGDCCPSNSLMVLSAVPRYSRHAAVLFPPVKRGAEVVKPSQGLKRATGTGQASIEWRKTSTRAEV